MDEKRPLSLPDTRQLLAWLKAEFRAKHGREPNQWELQRAYAEWQKKRGNHDQESKL